jgi:hypothetical protein
VPADGKAGSYDAWYLSTALDALKRHEGPAASDNAVELVCRDIEKIATAFDAGMARMRKEPDIAKRRELAQEVGPLVGQLDRAFKRSHELLPEGERQFATYGTDHMIGDAIAEFLSVCNWRIAA